MSTKPIYIYEGGGSNPHIIASIDTDKYSDHDSRAESAVISRQVNNISTIEIVIPANCEASKAITNTSDLVLYDTNGNLQEFHITDIDDVDEYSVTRTIYAELSFGELINSVIIGDASMPTSTNPADYLAYILSFTRWSVGTVDSGIYNSKWDEDITGLTCLEAFQKLIDKYNCEFVIRYETDGKNKITGRYVDLKKSIGHNYGKRFEDSKDILGLKSSLDLDSIRTAIYPRIRKDYMDDNGNSRTEYVDISSVVWSVAAGDPVDKPAGQTVLVNPDAETIYKRYNTKDGKLMERVMYAEWTNESAIDAEDLCSQAWTILKANGVLNPTIKVTAGDLYRMSGDDPDYSHEQVDLGDTCIIIDRNFEPELRLTTRVMEMEEDILNPVNNTYVFGNYRKTLATSNIESQKSVEEQLTDLYNKLQGVKVDYELPYQSGKKPYQEIKENVMNDFMSASGYVMAEDSDGFWVLDAPISTYSLRARTAASPTKAVILKGGMLGFAQYNPVTSSWEMGTFIDGMSVNADYINTGHLNADVISAGSITTDHLSTATVEYIKTGMATDDDLQGVIDSVAKDYATKDSVSSNINDAVKDLVSNSDMNSAITDATKDMATNSSVNNAISNATEEQNMITRLNAIKDLQKQLQAEYSENNSKATKIYADQYLPAGSTAKVNLNNKMTAYTTAYNNYNNYITTMIDDGTITEDEYNQYSTYATAYATAVKELAEAMEDANSARLANVYAQARQGLVTTAELEVNNESVIASAKAGMVSTGDMTGAITAATENLVSSDALNTAVTNATKDMATNSSVDTAITNATKDMATNSSVNSAISSATADMATNTGVTNAINGITVGSRNLALLTSDEWVSFTGFSGAKNDCRLSYTVLTNGLAVNDKMLVAFDYKLENMTYTSDKSPTIRIQGSGNVTEWNAGQFPIVNINLSSKPADATGTAYTIVTIDQNNIKNGCWYCNFRTDYIAGGTVSIKGIRVIRSSKLVSWIAAPEDAYTNTVFETFKAVTAEYNNNYKIATTLYSNSYLAGTAKSYLKDAYDGYRNKYNTVKAAHDDIKSNKHAGEGRKEAWNTALTSMQTYTETLALRVQEASTFINTAVYNASKNYTDGAIPDALTGYAKTSYVDAAKADAIADAKEGMVSTSQLEVNNTEILMKTASMGQYNLLRNSDFRDGTNYWIKYDGNSAPGAYGVVTDSDDVVISGEKSLRTWSNTGTNPVWSGYYQDVTLAGGTSYTLSYWLASYNCTARVGVWKGTANDSMLASKQHSQCNGGHNRSSWIYDSVTFTTSTAGTYRMFFQVYNTNNATGYGLFLIKPMLCTGINAQAWTAHPDEIHVGVVSVTEQDGIKVEHSDFSTYSVLNAAGLKVLTNSNSLIASFGESGSAYIGDLTCDGYVKSPQVMPVSKKVNGGIVNIYCSETGSGDFSGDSSNYVMGWAGAMGKVLDYLGIDYTHTEGGFVINTNTSDKRGLTFRIYIKGSTFTNNIELYNIYGHATFEIRFDSGCKYTGQMRFYDLEPEIAINGSGKAILHRGTSEDYAIYCYNVKRLGLNNIYINYANASSYNYPIYAYNTSCHFLTVDFCNCSIMASIDNCYLEAGYCVGSMTRYISGGNLSLINLSSAKVPAVSASSPYGSAANVSSITSFTPTSSAQQGSQPVTINVTKTYNSETYASFRTGTYRPGILLQGAPSAEELNKFGNYFGRIYFAKAVITEALDTITNPVVTLYLERASAISSATDYVDIYVAGSYVGELQGDKSKWFTLSTTAINSIKNNGYVEINGTGVDNYTQFKTNAVLKITGTQTK